MEQTVEEFFHDFRQDILAGAEAEGAYQLEAFMKAVSDELIETGFIEGFEQCHYRAARGIRVDGYWFGDDESLNLFVADFECRRELEVLTSTDVEAAFKRVANFLDAAIRNALEPDVTTPEYGLIRQIVDRGAKLQKVNLFLVSERVLSSRFDALADGEIHGLRTKHHIWDMGRLDRQRSSRGHKEALEIDFVEMFGDGLNCLPATADGDSYQSFLLVMPGKVLASLYDRYGSRLLEQNVRTYLQARGRVNQGITTTIRTEPQMFFAYNNGITATAQEVETRMTAAGLEIVRIIDLQIVNGGQTTASLYHTQRRYKADLSGVSVQMKLSVIDSEQGEMIVPRISEYANTQNRVNAADFFSNHPFHVRMEGFSRRIWAPPRQGEQRETKWFYERTRGQYSDAQSKLTTAEKRRFKAEFPKIQMFAKTDLAKFENVFDDEPKWVNLGSQKNFARFAQRIGREWSKSSDAFNEDYFRRAVARGILFRETEKLVSSQPWYAGGYRANIVAYALAMLGEIVRRQKAVLDHQSIWARQTSGDHLLSAIAIIAKSVNEDITRPPHGISNISEWCKKDGCWLRLVERADDISGSLTEDFMSCLLSNDDGRHRIRDAKQVQRIDDGIEVQREIMNVPPAQWSQILREGVGQRLLSEKEAGILRIAEQMPAKIPTDRQSAVLMDVLTRARQAGIA